MATLDEILEAMPDEGMTAAVTDEMLVIDPNTRQISIPSAELTFGVEGDADSERKYFLCPRYVGDNVDLTSCFIRVNYRNANGDMDEYLVNDVVVDGENVVFSWELSGKAIKYKGQTRFVVCAIGPDAKLAWHTTQATGLVLAGLEPDNSHVAEGTSDVVAQLIGMVNAQTAAVEAEGATQVQTVRTAAETAEAASVAQIEAKGASTLATIPEDYTAVQNAVRGAANAIRKKVSGEVIRVDDVSPMEHYPEIKVRGKNLFNIGALEVMPESYTTKISKIDVSNNSITITTAASHTGNGYCGLTNGAGNYVIALRDLCPQMEAGKTYTLSGITDSETKTMYLRGVNRSWVFGTAMTITEEYLDAKVALYGLNSASGEGTGDCVIRNLQIEEGKTATEYTPYIDPTTVTVRRCGKNILSLPYYEGQKVERDGITGTVNADGSIHLVGTATTNFYFRFGTINLGSTPILAGNNNGRYSLQNCTYDSANKFVYHQVSKGETVDKTVYPLVEAGTTKTDYETPYAAETQIPSPDGAVSGFSAVAPTMTLMTDTPGVNIECEYSRDTNAVIAEILEKITALGG